MKKVFWLKKDEVTDWDTPLHHFLETELIEIKKPGDFPKFKKHFKVTIIIEEVPLWLLKSVRK